MPHRKVAGYAVTLGCAAGGPNPIKGYHVVITGPSARDETLPGGPA
ncbi:hypothetical protein [uncultured Thiodictyon sp.]|jgi:hypothetical protein|nr:hypothetical protein [uncultured Thiodictyon sp.]